MLAASLDVAFVRAIASSARREIEEGHPGVGNSSMLFVGRLIAKAGLLVLAVLFPQSSISLARSWVCWSSTSPWRAWVA